MNGLLEVGSHKGRQQFVVSVLAYAGECRPVNLLLVQIRVDARDHGGYSGEAFGQSVRDPLVVPIVLFDNLELHIFGEVTRSHQNLIPHLLGSQHVWIIWEE